MADVDVPKVGKVDKKVLIPIVAGAGLFIGYRYWKARQDVGTGDVPPDYEDPGTLPGVAGAVKPDNSYGSGTDTSSTTPGGGFRGLTNSQWTEYVTDRLRQDDRWTYSDIAVALGNYLTAKPTTTEQQAIVQAAIGVAGYPPVSGYALISGGNTPVTVAPTGVSGTTGANGAPGGPTSMRVSFTPVPGAATYNVYVNGGARGTGAKSPVDVFGLTPGTSYTVQVAAVSPAGVAGPKSSSVTVKTPNAAMATPGRPAISVNTGGGRITFKTNTVPYATGYQWFLNGKLFNSTTTPAVTYTGLKPKALYSPGVTVKAMGPNQALSKMSSALSFRTK